MPVWHRTIFLGFNKVYSMGSWKEEKWRLRVV